MTDSPIAGRAPNAASPQDATGQVVRACPSRGTGGRLHAALLGSLLVLGVVTSHAQAPVKQILMLQTFDRGSLVLDDFTANFRESLSSRAGKPVNIVQVVVGPTGFVGGSDRAIVDYIRSMYAGRRPPDLIVTTGGPAASFARANRQQLFPRAALFFASVDQRWLGGKPLGEKETAAAVINDYPGRVNDIMSVLPDTRHVFVVTGAGSLGLFWRRELETALARFRDRVNIIWSDKLSLQEMLRVSASLPPHSAILYISLGTDAQGGTYADDEVLAALHATANAPMFAVHSTLLGHGIVGGKLMSIDAIGHDAGDIATRILSGEPLASLRVPKPTPMRSMFDWRELERWDIPESRLPPGSAVMYRRPTLWAEHKVAVLAAVAALLLQSLLIVLLLYERRARQRAELQSRRNLDLATDADRRETISALTTSISHELAQPLTAILYNAQALQRMVAANRGAPPEILADITSGAVLATQIIERHRTMLRSHQLQKKPIDLHAVIHETVTLVAHDMKARQVEVNLDLSATPCVIDGDQVLLTQVLLNLLRNAMDAMADAPRRLITIQTEVTAVGTELSVADVGTGLPAEIVGGLFTPFFTTKSRGLGIGLTIAQRIVEAHAGTIVARENISGGATFTITLPRSGAAKLPDGGSPQLPVQDSVSVVAGD